MSLQAHRQQLVLDHARRPRHFGALPDATHCGEGDNPGCGDRVTLWLRLRGGVIEEVGFTGRGCAVSQASASLLTGAVRGQTLAGVQALDRAFREMLRTGEAGAELGDLAALQGVHTLHTRVKCAALAWEALGRALEPEGRDGMTSSLP